MSQNDINAEREAETASPEAEAEQAEAAESAEAQKTKESKKHSIPKRVFFFGTCAVVALLLYALVNVDAFAYVYNTLGKILSPIIIGCVIAYLCNPIMRFYEYIVFGKMKKGGLHRILSLLMTVITVFGLVAGVIALIVPELINSINQLAKNLPAYAASFRDFVQNIINGLNEKLPEGVDIPSTDELLSSLKLNDIQSVLTMAGTFLSKFNAVDGIWNFFVNLFNALKDLLLGMFIAFYILASKEKRSAQIRKARAALLNEKQDKKFEEIVKLVDKTFGSYVKGVLLDALAVGVVTFILLSIFRVSEYNLLIAAICGVTNIIPVFGPFIGAIPSALIVLISNPDKLIVFIILILVIQQIDGNIIVPRIQGNNTGISSLAVLIAITVMGNLFGLMGMVIGVPIFAVIIELGKRALDERLKKRGRPTDTVEYYPSDSIGNAEEEVYYEHSHLRYLYDHSKLKAIIDLQKARRERRRRKKAAKRAAAAEAAKAVKAAERAAKRAAKKAEKAAKKANKK